MKKVISEASKHVLEVVKSNPGLSGYEICKTAVTQDFRNKVNSAIARLSARGLICTDKHTQPHRYYSVDYYGVVKRIDNLREFRTWLTQFDQEKAIPMAIDKAVIEIMKTMVR